MDGKIILLPDFLRKEVVLWVRNLGWGNFIAKVFFESRECVNGLKNVGLCLCVSNVIVGRMDVVAPLCTIVVVG